ncbi:gluconate 2-dehydrogenase subunit 3 family protein [Cellvibrio sp. KY-YJ-3]|uniref:gluconate 2-dehydrogenase subunit 3 family protein n=1 Tax=Cellvibrio sp. KY-YJ-3 TaxID=454662 RepID=UPI00124400C3|nr:gluconate 2-dehydrogenase subunit 3 family protein [Cellvibrio sp. KY-YJ-3]QEY12020.1 gluconate 2-dehydrogenase subunit 3 family protein [Cellvibrio sp. KY-YJ-3]
MNLSALPYGSDGIARRTALKQLALACCLALSASSLSALAASFSAPTDFSRRKKTLLSSDQLQLLRELGDIIIPTTDTPGAIAAGVHDFINHYAAYCASSAEQQQLLATLARIEAGARSEFNTAFLTLTKAQQLQLLNAMEQAQNGFSQADRKGLKQLKALVVFGYYTSEPGATQELAYLAIPGGYKGNFKLKEIGRAWALNF